jgi:hypothetical protein
VKTSNQKADGLNVAPILKAGWLLKKRRMDLRSLCKSNTFNRDTNDHRQTLHRAGAASVFAAGNRSVASVELTGPAGDHAHGGAESPTLAARSATARESLPLAPLALAGRAIPRSRRIKVAVTPYPPNSRVQISS